MNQNCSQNVRYGCAFHGALRTALEIPGVVPIVHSNTGCAAQGSLSDYTSGLGYGPYGASEILSTNVLERHVVFGGASRLREQIKNSTKVVKANLFAVLNGCESSMVGDDIAAIVKEAVEQDIPVFGNETAGFKGLPHIGYQIFMDNLIRALPLIHSSDERTTDKTMALVNLFGIIPGANVHFKGDLLELSNLLKGIGVSTNYLFHAEGLEDLQRLPEASLSVVLSKWGLPAAKRLEELYGIPWILISEIPIGPAAVGEFLKTVGDALQIPEQKIEKYIEEQESIFQDYFQRVYDYYYAEDIEKKIIIVSDGNYAKGYAKFLKQYLGAQIEQIIETDYQENGKREEEQVVEGQTKADWNSIRQSLVRTGAQMIIGSSLESHLGEELGIANIATEYPLENQIVLNTTYIGITGALRLLEDYVSAVIRHNRCLQKQLTGQLIESDIWGE